MANLSIRHLDPRLKYQLRVRAALHDRSMAAEAREILRQALTHPTAAAAPCAAVTTANPNAATPDAHHPGAAR